MTRSRAWAVVSSGVLALNTFGIDEWVPTAFEYVSDGSYHTMEASGTKAFFRYSANKGVEGVSPTTFLIVQTLKALGPEGVAPDALRTIAPRLKEEERKSLHIETAWSAQWARKACKKITREGNAR